MIGVATPRTFRPPESLHAIIDHASWPRKLTPRGDGGCCDGAATEVVDVRLRAHAPHVRACARCTVTVFDCLLWLDHITHVRSGNNSLNERRARPPVGRPAYILGTARGALGLAGERARGPARAARHRGRRAAARAHCRRRRGKSLLVPPAASGATPRGRSRASPLALAGPGPPSHDRLPELKLTPDTVALILRPPKPKASERHTPS